MARDGISKAQVFNAADAISAAGQSPTVASIRAKLGTGSYTTITAMLREWKTQADTKTDDEESDVPEEVTEALGRAASIVWKAAQDHFRHELSTMKRESERTQEAAQQQIVEAYAEIERLENENAQAVEKLAASAAFVLDLQAEGNQQHSAQVEQAATIKALEARVKSQDELLRRLVPEPKKDPKSPAKVAAVTRPKGKAFGVTSLDSKAPAVLPDLLAGPG